MLLPAPKFIDSVYSMDAASFMAAVPTGSINLIITSPPYFRQRLYGPRGVGGLGLEATPQLYVSHLVQVLRSCKRILSDDGSLFLNIGDKYLNKTLQLIPSRVGIAMLDDGWYVRNEIIWHKSNPMPESVKDRLTRSHEQVYWFAKSKHPFTDMQAVMVPAKYDGRKDTLNKGSAKYKAENIYPDSRPQSMAAAPHERWIKNDQGEYVKNRRDVWTIGIARHGGNHFAVYPEELVETIVRMASKPGDVVCDPFMGSGTTARVASTLGRHFTGCDSNHDYVKQFYTENPNL